MTNINLTAERHIRSLSNNGACIKAQDGTKEPVSMGFYRRAVEQCVKGGCNAIAYELELPGIDADFMIAFWRDAAALWGLQGSPSKGGFVRD